MNSFTYSAGPSWHHALNHSPEDIDTMIITNRKPNTSSVDAWLGKGRSEEVRDSVANNFDLRGTLAETQVGELSFAEFLAVLKQTGKSTA